MSSALMSLLFFRRDYGRGSEVNTEVVDFVLHKAAVRYDSVSDTLLTQGAVGEFLNFYHFLFLFLFGERLSVQLDSSKPDVKQWKTK